MVIQFLVKVCWQLDEHGNKLSSLSLLHFLVRLKDQSFDLHYLLDFLIRHCVLTCAGQQITEELVLSVLDCTKKGQLLFKQTKSCYDPMTQGTVHIDAYFVSSLIIHKVHILDHMWTVSQAPALLIISWCWTLSLCWASVSLVSPVCILKYGMGQPAWMWVKYDADTTLDDAWWCKVNLRFMEEDVKVMGWGGGQHYQGKWSVTVTKVNIKHWHKPSKTITIQVG